jgi:1-acyl-sn-glycerol-3-phosphate acyltransferase
MTLFTFAVFAVDILFAPCALLILVPVRGVVLARRKYISLVTRFFSEFAMELIQRVCGTEIFVYSSGPSTAEFIHERVGPLVISNHRTRVDWLYCFWWYGAYVHMGEYLRVVLKDALRSVPFYGWAMQMSMYIFLQRSREADVPHIYNVMSYLLKTSEKVSTLIFPEGTDLSESNVRKSCQYARERGLPEYRYVMYPKPTGFMTCAEAVRDFRANLGGSNGSGGGLREGCYVHDLTMAFRDYVPGERPNENSLLLGIYIHAETEAYIVFKAYIMTNSLCFLGRLPREVHIVVDRIALEDVPSGRADLDKVSHYQHG